jgi:hypothetical protein
MLNTIILCHNFGYVIWFSTNRHVSFSGATLCEDGNTVGMLATLIDELRLVITPHDVPITN